MSEPITLEDFKKRIVTLLLRSGLTDLPKGEQDRQILFKSATLQMKRGEPMSESEVNEHLSRWLQELTSLKFLDHIALRRALVDYGYLERSNDGSAYQLSPDGPRQWSFDPAIDEVDLETLLVEARQEIEARKQAYLKYAAKKT
jgi:hypothetical protein